MNSNGFGNYSSIPSNNLSSVAKTDTFKNLLKYAIKNSFFNISYQVGFKNSRQNKYKDRPLSSTELINIIDTGVNEVGKKALISGLFLWSSLEESKRNNKKHISIVDIDSKQGRDKYYPLFEKLGVKTSWYGREGHATFLIHLSDESLKYCEDRKIKQFNIKCEDGKNIEFKVEGDAKLPCTLNTRTNGMYKFYKGSYETINEIPTIPHDVFLDLLKESDKANKDLVETKKDITEDKPNNIYEFYKESIESLDDDKREKVLEYMFEYVVVKKNNSYSNAISVENISTESQNNKEGSAKIFKDSCVYYDFESLEYLAAYELPLFARKLRQGQTIQEIREELKTNKNLKKEVVANIISILKMVGINTPDTFLRKKRKKVSEETLDIINQNKSIFKLNSNNVEDYINKENYYLLKNRDELNSDVFDKKKCTILKLPKKSGKTTKIVKYFQKIKSGLLVVVTPRVSLNSAIAKAMNGTTLDKVDDLQKLQKESKKKLKTLVLCPDSLYKLKGLEIDYTMIDEVHSVNETLHLGNTKVKDNRYENWTVLRKAMKMSKKVILASADFSTVDLKEILHCIDRNNISFYDGWYKTTDKQTVHLEIGSNRKLSLYSQYIKKLEKIIQDKKLNRKVERIAVTFENLKEMKTIDEKYREIYKTNIDNSDNFLSTQQRHTVNDKSPLLLTICSSTTSTEYVSDFFIEPNSFIKNNDIRFMLSSPSLCSGVSIESNQFTNTYSFFQGVQSYSDFMQQVSRVRNANDRYIHLNNFSKENFTLTLDDMYDLIFRPSEYLNQMASKEMISFVQNSYQDMKKMVYYSEERNVSLFNFKLTREDALKSPEFSLFIERLYKHYYEKANAEDLIIEKIFEEYDNVIVNDELLHISNEESKKIKSDIERIADSQITEDAQVINDEYQKISTEVNNNVSGNSLFQDYRKTRLDESRKSYIDSLDISQNVNSKECDGHKNYLIKYARNLYYRYNDLPMSIDFARECLVKDKQWMNRVKLSFFSQYLDKSLIRDKNIDTQDIRDAKPISTKTVLLRDIGLMNENGLNSVVKDWFTTENVKSFWDKAKSLGKTFYCIMGFNVPSTPTALINKLLKELGFITIKKQYKSKRYYKVAEYKDVKVTNKDSKQSVKEKEHIRNMLFYYDCFFTTLKMKYEVLDGIATRLPYEPLRRVGDPEDNRVFFEPVEPVSLKL